MRESETFEQTVQRKERDRMHKASREHLKYQMKCYVENRVTKKLWQASERVMCQ